MEERNREIEELDTGEAEIEYQIRGDRDSNMVGVSKIEEVGYSKEVEEVSEVEGLPMELLINISRD